MRKVIQMRSSSIYRSNLSEEKVAFLSDIKRERELNKEDNNTPKTYKRQEKSKELDILWQDFKPGTKEEKSPGVYLLTGFIAGILCVFMMNFLVHVSSNILSHGADTQYSEQPKAEEKISEKEQNIKKDVTVENEKKSSIAVVSAKTEESSGNKIPSAETYTVKSGDSMSSVVYRFYGKYDPSKVEKIKQVNNLTSEHKLSIGQQLIIPLD